MKTGDMSKTQKKRPGKSVLKGTLVVQLIHIAELTVRNSKDTAEQKDALVLKELLENHAAKTSVA